MSRKSYKGMLQSLAKQLEIAYRRHIGEHKAGTDKEEKAFRMGQAYEDLFWLIIIEDIMLKGIQNIYATENRIIDRIADDLTAKEA